MKFYYRKVRWFLLAALLISVILLTVAVKMQPGELVRTICIYGGFVLFLAAVIVMLIGFKCPACGAHFFRNALFLRKCPVCGFEFHDFELGKKVELPADFMQKEQIEEPLTERKRWF